MLSVNTSFVVLAALISLTTMNASAESQASATSPITLKLGGTWETLSSGPNVLVTATFDSFARDQNPWSRIGAYQLSSVTFSFAQLGKFSTPFELIGDITQSKLHLYPSSEDTPTGEVRLFGWFDSSASFPNGLVPIEYDLRMHFTSLADDRLSAIAGLGCLTYSSLYLTDQIGGRSSDFFQSEVQVIQSAVPEPASYAMLLAGFGLIGFKARRRKVIQA